MPTQPIADKLSAAAVVAADGPLGAPTPAASPQSASARESGGAEQLLAQPLEPQPQLGAPITVTVGGWLAWSIVALAFTTDGLCLGARSFFAVVLEHWEVEFGWSRSYVSGAMSLVHVCNGLATPFAGHVVDVLGARGGLTAGILYLATFLALTAAVQHAWQLWVIFGVGLGTGFGLLNLNVYSAIVIRIFPHGKTGLALGITTSGSTCVSSIK